VQYFSRVSNERPASTAPVRIDKWLWAARFYKTRSLAAAAVEGGKIQVDGERAKPSKAVKPGSEVRVRQGPYEHVVIVTGTAERRGTASQAALLFDETAASREAREKLHWQLTKAAPAMEPAPSRPTKRDRRLLDRFRDR
jgi:ribosome-associated heat shock protein Hsp15